MATDGTPLCDVCGESIGVYGWMRYPASSVAPRALCRAHSGCNARIVALARAYREAERRWQSDWQLVGEEGRQLRKAVNAARAALFAGLDALDEE
jgi:hypothetical protein